MAYLEVEGSKQIYFEHHEGQGRPVVLVHGWGATSRAWETVLPALLANGNEVVLLDQRACGRSDNDFSDVSITALGADVALLCRRLSLHKPVVNGWSLGGAVAVEAASKLGGDMGGLVLTGGASPRYTAAADWPHGATLGDVQGVLDGLAADRPTTLRGVAGSVCAKPVSAAVLDWMWGMFLEMGPRGDRSLRDLADVDQRKALGALTVPMLSLHGTEDGFVPFSGAEAAVELCQDARLVPFEGCGHAPFVEDHEKYLAELIGFLNR
ncbi:putative hydrolase or acyltransferase of alpha/beta superfamily [Prauserella sp. Am3]|nr:putative hydrolase or acyltransferase of alpha/beta superfamily [Prauserella sp. Am3]